jgi:hypothetical protein
MYYHRNGETEYEKNKLIATQHSHLLNKARTKCLTVD